MKRRTVLSGFGASLALGGCSALGALGNAARPLDVYDLQPPVDLPVASRQSPREVIVEVPATAGSLNTDRILVRPDRFQAQYLPDARWGEETPLMLQTLMVRSLQATQGLLFVGRRPLSRSGDVAVVSELVAFEGQITATGPAVSIVLELRLVAERDATIFAARRLEAEAAAASSDTRDIVAAFDAATGALLSDFTTWTMARLGLPL
ncbi:MAG: ABC-type transport auxiliary lipoprotein family protein [Pseudomonadota bacterium]